MGMDFPIHGEVVGAEFEGENVPDGKTVVWVAVDHAVRVGRCLVTLLDRDTQRTYVSMRAALRSAVDGGVQTMCLNCLHGVHQLPNGIWTHGPGGWEGRRCPQRLTGAEPFEFVDLLDALDTALGADRG